MCLCEHLGHVVYLFMFRDGFFFVNDRLHTAALYQSKKKLKVMIYILTFFFSVLMRRQQVRRMREVYRPNRARRRMERMRFVP